MKLIKNNGSARFEIEVGHLHGTTIPFELTGKISLIRILLKSDCDIKNLEVKLKISETLLTERHLVHLNTSLPYQHHKNIITYLPNNPGIVFRSGTQFEIEQPNLSISRIILYISELETESPLLKPKPMDNYILLKDLPDAIAGTKIEWDNTDEVYFYVKKGNYVSPHYRNYLTKYEVINKPEWFAKEIVKPPLGIMPFELHQEFRLHDINEAIARHEGTKFEIPAEWIAEKETLESFINGRIRDKQVEEKSQPVRGTINNYTLTYIHDEIPVGIKGLQEYIQTIGRKHRRLQILNGYLLNFCESWKSGVPNKEKTKDGILPDAGLSKPNYEYEIYDIIKGHGDFRRNILYAKVKELNGKQVCSATLDFILRVYFHRANKVSNYFESLEKFLDFTDEQIKTSPSLQKVETRDHYAIANELILKHCSGIGSMFTMDFKKGIIRGIELYLQSIKK